jgi:hypothetical protein
MRTVIVVASAIGLAALGCSSAACPAGSTSSEGRCIAIDARVEDAPGPCATACSEPTPVCDEANGACVACVGNANCVSAAQAGGARVIAVA